MFESYSILRDVDEEKIYYDFLRSFYQQPPDYTTKHVYFSKFVLLKINVIHSVVCFFTHVHVFKKKQVIYIIIS